MKFDLEKNKLIFLLIFTDLVFIILHILYINTNLLATSLYSLSRDRGYAEFFQYTKELWVAVLFLLLGIRHRSGLYLAFSFMFLYFLIDDSLEVHEQVGGLLASFWGLQPALGLRAVDFGELIVYGAFGLLFIGLIALMYLFSEPSIRRIARHLIGMTAVLAVFGVLIDMIGIMVDHPGIERTLVVVEEGGEMLVMSVITWFVYHISLIPGQELLEGQQSQLPE
jgi:hypothetical protein